MSRFTDTFYASTNGLISKVIHGSPCNFIKYKTHITQLQTPAFLININKIKKNCQNMENIALKYNLNLRCHVKTHKTLQIAQLQTLNQIDKRIETSTLTEAQYFSDALMMLIIPLHLQNFKK